VETCNGTRKEGTKKLTHGNAINQTISGLEEYLLIYLCLIDFIVLRVLTA